MWQIGNHAISSAKAMTLAIVVEEFGLHASHVYTGGTFTSTTLASDTQIHGFSHGTRGEGICVKLSSYSEAKRVGTPAGDVPLVASNSIRWAHYARVGLSAGTIVVTHLNCASQATPFGPVQCGLDVSRPVIRFVAKKTTIIHARWTHNTSGIKQALWIETVLDFFKQTHDVGSKHFFVELRSYDAITMFAGVGSFVLANHSKGLFRDGAHLANIGFGFHIEDGAHMQASDRSVCIPSATCAVFCKHLV